MDVRRNPEDRAATRSEVASGDSYGAPASTVPARRHMTYRHNVRRGAASSSLSEAEPLWR